MAIVMQCTRTGCDTALESYSHTCIHVCAHVYSVYMYFDNWWFATAIHFTEERLLSVVHVYCMAGIVHVQTCMHV